MSKMPSEKETFFTLSASVPDMVIFVHNFYSPCFPYDEKQHQKSRRISGHWRYRQQNKREKQRKKKVFVEEVSSSAL
jgi:Zn-finger nucleic acid-binding protein